MNTPTDTTLQITRVIRAPRDRVYAAWADPEEMNKWSGPEGVETITWDSDPRVGGKCQWNLRARCREKMTVHGEYREVLSGEKLVYTWQWAGDPQWEGVESLV